MYAGRNKANCYLTLTDDITKSQAQHNVPVLQQIFWQVVAGNANSTSDNISYDAYTSMNFFDI